MNNKYIGDSNQLQKIKELCKGIVDVKELEIANEFKLITLSIDGEGIKEANLLDELNTNIHSNLEKIFLVTCDSSEYYNKELYSLINSMERKLREFVYIAIIKNDKEQFRNLYGKLEKIDFGELYKMLFTDESFIKGAKSIINQGKHEKLNLILNGSFSKEEILTLIKQVEEHTMWDKVNEGKSIPKLKKEFHKIKNFRNNVMHAHNINQGTYESAKSLYLDLNEELNSEIENILSKNSEYYIREDLSDYINSTIDEYERNSITKSGESIEHLSELLKNSQFIDINIKNEDIIKTMKILTKKLSKINDTQN